MTARPLRFKGGDVRLVRRLAGGRVRVEYLNRGKPTGMEADAWPHELTGHPGGLPAIKAMIAALTPPESPDLQDAPPRPRLHAHFAAVDDDREDEQP